MFKVKSNKAKKSSKALTKFKKFFFKTTENELFHYNTTTPTTSNAKSLEALHTNTEILWSRIPTTPKTTASAASLKLTRSKTQPIQTTSSSPSLLSRKLLRNRGFDDEHSLASSNQSEQFTLSLGSDSGRIFEMSGIDTDSAMQDSAIESTPTTGAAGAPGLVRQNSVRARVNLYQKTQAQTPTSTSASPSVHSERAFAKTSARLECSTSPTTPWAMDSLPISKANDELKTPQNTLNADDEEIEPSSLPISEKMRFFSNLTGSANRASPPILRNSPPLRNVERCASSSSAYSFYSTRSNISVSSGSVTPTPMECNDVSATMQNGRMDDVAHEILERRHSKAETQTQTLQPPEVIRSTAFLQLSCSSTSSFLTARGSSSSECAVTPTSSLLNLTPVAKRIRFKTIGKLLMPEKFRMQDGNNNNNICNGSNNSNNLSHEPSELGMHSLSSHSNTSTATLINNSSSTANATVDAKKIGKIKSPFIENCQQLQATQAHATKSMKRELRSASINGNACFDSIEMPTKMLRKQNSMQNGSDDSNPDSGKENNSDSGKAKEDSLQFVEMRKKFTRLGSNSTPQTAVDVANGANSNTRKCYSGSRACSVIDSKFAKYFGITPTAPTSAATSTSTAAAATCSQQQCISEQRNAHSYSDMSRASAKRLWNCTRNNDDFQQHNGSSTSASNLAAAVNRHVRLQSVSMHAVRLQTSTVEVATAANAPTTAGATAANTPTSSAALKRRDMAKRNRSLTTFVTPPKTSNQDAYRQSYAGAITRTCPHNTRMRSHTLTNGIQAPQVQRFEDIPVTKEEFQLASKEFDRIFLDVLCKEIGM